MTDIEYLSTTRPAACKSWAATATDRTTIAFDQHLAAATEGFRAPPQFG